MIVKDSSWSLLTLLLLILHSNKCLSLICNYCYHADLREDCLLNVLQCEPGHVCSVETSLVTYYFYLFKGLRKQVNMYRMVCEHYSMCRDGTVSGAGQYGYTVTTKICCCNHLCEEADGVGKGLLEVCPSLWSNYTTSNNSRTLHIRKAFTEYFMFNIFMWITL